jgi:hypothetical protein
MASTIPGIANAPARLAMSVLRAAPAKMAEWIGARFIGLPA